MKLIRKNAKPGCILLAFLMMTITTPFQSVLAAMISTETTETTVDSTRAQQAHDEITSLLLREDVQNALISYGIGPQEAKARIDSLSDAEVLRIADQIDKLPAGGSMGLPVWIGVVVLAGIILIVYLIISFIAPPVEVEK